MLNVLDVIDDPERNEREDSGPEAEIAKPDVLVVFDLQSSLNSGCCDERPEGNL
jgi:hypothetical protein